MKDQTCRRHGFCFLVALFRIKRFYDFFGSQLKGLLGLTQEIEQAEGHLAIITHSADLIYTNVMGPVGIDSLSNIS